MLLALRVVFGAGGAGADLAPEPLWQNAKLGTPGPHWALYLDIALDRLDMSRSGPVASCEIWGMWLPARSPDARPVLG